MRSESTVEVIDKGMKCLFDNLGSDGTEIFISTILKERFDYTKWRRIIVDSIETDEDLDRFIAESKKIGGFEGNPKVVL